MASPEPVTPLGGSEGMPGVPPTAPAPADAPTPAPADAPPNAPPPAPASAPADAPPPAPASAPADAPADAPPPAPADAPADAPTPAPADAPADARAPTRAGASADARAPTRADAPATGPPADAPTASVVGQVLPMYFVGDESHSMVGAPIAAVNRGLLDLRDEVAKHPLIGKKVRFGIITFADTAETRLELSELSEDIVLPTLSTRGRGTSYASALEALRQSIPADIALLKSSGYQVHRPSVFFLSDGQPTEDEEKWRTRLEELKEPGFRERPNILAFGVGDADPKVIQQLATSPRYGFMMTEGASTAGAIAEFAASMLNSMVASAERLDRGEQTIEFEKPEGFVQLDAPLV
jgi:uncharacterized protein YegL